MISDNKAQILIVDDEKMNVKVMAEFLNDTYNCLVIENA